MGINVSELNFLFLCQRRGVDFSRVLMMGRQSLNLSKETLQKMLLDQGITKTSLEIDQIVGDGFSEGLFKFVFGAKVVDSVDASNHENASIVHDMNYPLKIRKKYSAVIDFGCLEHVFNFPMAIDSLVESCKTNGHILHALPANNSCGHGFYQFSPELFFSLYSSKRGFDQTSVFLVEISKPKFWYKVVSTLVLRKRVNVVNSCETYCMVLTRKLKKSATASSKPPEQSDYLAIWKKRNKATEQMIWTMRERFKKVMGALGLLTPIRLILINVKKKPNLLGGNRTDVFRMEISKLIGRG
jgi:hypothetical protein